MKLKENKRYIPRSIIPTSPPDVNRDNEECLAAINPPITEDMQSATVESVNISLFGSSHNSAAKDNIKESSGRESRAESTPNIMARRFPPSFL